jgi:predicted RNA-binding Zn-ribbon protein involved in translation (DUF1610 family)
MDCPACGSLVGERKGSPVSPYINVYRCASCGWSKLRCGNTRCDGYMEQAYTGMGSTYRYTCATCGWTGTGPAFESPPAPALAGSAPSAPAGAGRHSWWRRRT